VLVEAHDEWHVSERRHLSEGSMVLLATSIFHPEGGSHTSTSHGIVGTSSLTRSMVKITYATRRDVAPPAGRSGRWCPDLAQI
jgi:hypothetical protein